MRESIKGRESRGKGKDSGAMKPDRQLSESNVKQSGIIEALTRKKVRLSVKKIFKEGNEKKKYKMQVNEGEVG